MRRDTEISIIYFQRMPETCIVESCKQRGPISFTVPRDEELLGKWMKALMLDETPRARSRVCFRHFKHEDISKMKNLHKLVKGSVPNLKDNYGVQETTFNIEKQESGEPYSVPNKPYSKSLQPVENPSKSKNAIYQYLAHDDSNTTSDVLIHSISIHLTDWCWHQ